MKYYNVQKNWTRLLAPHLSNSKLNSILVRDFNKYTMGRWRKRFKPRMYPAEFDSCDWRCNHRGTEPRFWSYVCWGACHWLVNFNFILAKLALPQYDWQIITTRGRPKEHHSSVWDGKETLFDMNFLALGVKADDCFRIAYGSVIHPDDLMPVHYARHYLDRD